MVKRFAILVFLLVWTFFVQASFALASFDQVDKAVYTGTPVNLLDHAQIAQDPERVGSATELGLLNWIPSQGSELLLGANESAVWLRSTIMRASLDQVVLNLASPLVDYVDVWLFKENSITPVQHWRAGRRLPYDMRDAKVTDLAFNLPLQRDLTYEVVLRFDSWDGLYDPIPIELVSKKQLSDSYNEDLIWYGLLFGALAAMLIYNFLVFAFQRDLNFLFYIIYLSNMGAVLLLLSGIVHKFLLPNSPIIASQLQPALSCVATFFAMIFLTRMIEAKKHTPKLYNFTFRFCCLLIVPLAMTSVGFYKSSYVLFTLILVVFGLLINTMIVISILKGHVVARFILLAWSVVIVAAGIYCTNLFLTLPLPFDVIKLVDVGVAIEFILLSFTLAYRLKMMEQSKLAAEKKASNYHRMLTVELEQQVEDRTKKLKEAKEKAEYLARVDELTQLYNRRAFMEFANQLLENKEAKHTTWSLLMIDIDNFKMINDTWGHEAGDNVLQIVSQIIAEKLNRQDVGARFGGEEFVALLPNTGVDDAALIAESIRTHIESCKIKLSGQMISITTSIGVASQNSETQHSVSQMLRDADIALYKAKKAGRNRVEYTGDKLP